MWCGNIIDMNIKVLIGIIVFAIIAIIIGLVVLLQKQPKTEAKTDENGLEIVGEQGTQSVSGIPSPSNQQSEIQMQEEQIQPTKDITNITKPEMNINTKKEYSAVLTTTEGYITISFTTKETPITVNNFVSLAREGFYDDTIFHRVIKGFMIQGGDPKGDGTGGPGYKFDDEEFEGEYTRGTVAMANSGPNTNGSQFFIMHGDTALPPSYVIFGKVTDGLDVVDAIATADVTAGPSGEPSSPVKPVKITKVKITEK